MTTALRNIQFSKPMLVGEANSGGGTTYALGSYDTIGPIAKGIFTPPDDTQPRTMWGFDGFARYASAANYAYSAYKASCIDFGSDSVYGLGTASVGDLPTIDFGSPTGSWAILSNYLSDLNDALRYISGQTITTVRYEV